MRMATVARVSFPRIYHPRLRNPIDGQDLWSNNSDDSSRVRTADQSAAGALTGGRPDRDSAGEGTGGTFSEKFSSTVRTLQNAELFTLRSLVQRPASTGSKWRSIPPLAVSR